MVTLVLVPVAVCTVLSPPSHAACLNGHSPDGLNSWTLSLGQVNIASGVGQSADSESDLLSSCVPPFTLPSTVVPLDFLEEGGRDATPYVDLLGSNDEFLTTVSADKAEGQCRDTGTPRAALDGDRCRRGLIVGKASSLVIGT